MMITKNKLVLEQILPKTSLTVGAQVIFSGIVRNHHEGKKVLRFFYECYEPMAQKQIQKIMELAKVRWSLDQAQIVHRVGEIPIGEIAVVVVTEAIHRKQAYEANQWIMDAIKHEVPIWKKEFYEDESSQWVVCSHAPAGI